MKWLALMTFALILAACASSAPTGLTTGQAALATQQQTPALQLGLLEEGVATTLRRISLRDGISTWVSADGVTVSTKEGIIVATRGFGGDVMGADTAPLMQALADGQDTAYARNLSVLNGENRVETLAFDCAFSSLGAREAQTLAGPQPATLFQEDCRDGALRVLNLYFVDGSGRVIQTRQWGGPAAGVLTTLVLN